MRTIPGLSLRMARNTISEFADIETVDAKLWIQSSQRITGSQALLRGCRGQ